MENTSSPIQIDQPIDEAQVEALGEIFLLQTAKAAIQENPGNKLMAVKVLKDRTNIGLKDAHDLVSDLWDEIYPPTTPTE